MSFYTKYFAVWVLVFGMIAYFAPAPFTAMKNYNKLFFSLTMFGIGAVLQIEDFKRIAEKPIIVLIGCCAQFTIMPLGASNVMSYIAKADTAYSVSLTTVSTLLCPLLTPGLTFLLARSQLDIPFWAMVLDVIYMVIVPLFLGFAARHFFSEKLEKVLPIFPAISVTFIIFICSLVIALNKERLAEVTAPVLAAAVLLNVYGMLAGYSVGSAFRMETRRRRTLSIEIGMQNAGLGTTLLLAHFGPSSAVPAALFVFICIITASIVAEFWHRTAPNPVAV
ncbi:MAG: bile acid:sodium symporter family protein [Planctomycetota bacterium]